MSFVQPQQNPSRLGVGIGVAVLFHVVLAWALLNGLGHKIVQVIKAPIEARVVEEVKPPPPPPPKVIEMPPPPKFTPPPPAFVPPPEVQVAAPPPPQPTITATVAEAPPAAPPVAPRAEEPPAPAAPAPAPAPAPTPVSAGVVCPNYTRVMGDAGFPREAVRAGLEEGSALVQFTVGTNGGIKDVKVLQASHPTFGRGAARIVGDFTCAGQGRDVTVQVPFLFKSD